MRKIYYDGKLKDDISNVLKIKKFEKREKVLTAGASLLGIASYGIMKTYGYDDMVSNYPLIAYYAIVFLEGKFTFNKYLKSKFRLENLVEDLSDEKETLLDSLLSARLETTEIESKTGEYGKSLVIEDFYIDDVDNVGLIRQEVETDIYEEKKTPVTYSLYSLNPEETKIIKRTR